eukprot:TRINITY_DN3576_c0_g1_i4.p2 TRINITY_DN3576_c0_g1~~TRINITY_DN3576_c0_g1_i4.p2  ORF type:complete len:105 (-),score=24.83 TRINITY_DN3576_c0_g1_i4:415-729(-)
MDRPGYQSSPGLVGQPGCAIYSDGELVYDWVLVPNEANLGGALDRPRPAEILGYVKAKLAGEEAVKPEVDTEASDKLISDAYKAGKMPQFVVDAAQKAGRTLDL